MNPDHIPAYVEELRSFSAIHRISCGQPDDLLALPSTLSTNERFRSEFGSMIRSFRYREHDGVNFNELMGLIAAAWGGPDAPTRTSPPPPWFAQLSLILRDILNRPPGEPPPLLIEDEPEEEPTPKPEISLTPTPIEAPPVTLPEIIAVQPLPNQILDSTPGNDYAQVLARRTKRSSGSYPTAAATPADANPDPWAEDSWLHRLLKAFQSTHPRRLFRRP